MHAVLPPVSTRPPARSAPQMVDFLCIGAQKAATTWFHRVISQHPRIVASAPKELDYFTAHYDRGADWYESHFAPRAPGQLLGECSPNAFCSLDAPRRAREYNPGLRLVAILRDPVARAFSNHLHEIRKGHIPESLGFAAAMARNRSYEAQSRYKANLSAWIAAFGRPALLVLFSEDIATDPATAFARVCAHLGLPPGPPPPALAERSHENIAARSPRLQRLLRGGGDALRAAGLERPLEGFKAMPGVRQALAANRRDLRQEIPGLAPAERAALAAAFAPDMAFVAGLTGRADLPWESWRLLQAGPEARAHGG